MEDDPNTHESSVQLTSVFKAAAGDLIAQRLESIAHEIRATGGIQAGIFANNETLGLLAALLKNTLKNIDDIFEFDGFVFTPACSLLLELFQARTRGNLCPTSTLIETVNCPPSVAERWIKVLESMQLIETIGNDGNGSKVALTGKGYLKTSEALKLLL